MLLVFERCGARHGYPIPARVEQSHVLGGGVKVVTRSKRTRNTPPPSWAWNLSWGKFVNLVLHVRAVHVSAV